MKREERLHRLFGGIEDELIEDAAQPPSLLYVWLPRIAAVAAAVVLTIGIAIGPWWEQSPPPITPPPTGDPSQEGTHSSSTITTTTQTATTTEEEDTSTTEDSTTTDPSSVTTSHTTRYTSKSYDAGGKTTTKHTDKSTTGKTGIKTTVEDDTRTTSKGGIKTTSKSTFTSSKQTSKSTTKGSTAGPNKTTKTTALSTTKTTSKDVPGFTTKTPNKSTTKSTKTTTGGMPPLTWDKMTNPQRFPYFRWNSTELNYFVHNDSLAESYVGERLADITVTGYDKHTATTHTIQACLFAINGVDPTAVVAIRYEGDSVYYRATNIDYTAVTLGDLIDDLNLKESITVGNINYDFRDEDNHSHKADYSGLTKEKLWELLLFDPTLPNVYEEGLTLSATVTVTMRCPFLANDWLCVSENGYLKLLDYRHVFYIGEEAAAAFIDYVLNHCTLENDWVLPANAVAGNPTSNEHPSDGVTTRPTTRRTYC